VSGYRGRQARLLPEFAYLYPPLAPGQWEPAGVLADRMLTWLMRQPSRAGYIARDRVLRPEHFEFRGGVVQNSPDPHPLTRWYDQKVDNS
jgi:hypothetical protein